MCKNISVFLIAILAVAMIGVMVPSVFAEPVSNDKNLPWDTFMFPKSQLIHFVFSKKQFDIIENDMKKFGKDNTGISRMLFDINIETILRTTVLN